MYFEKLGKRMGDYMWQSGCYPFRILIGSDAGSTGACSLRLNEYIVVRFLFPKMVRVEETNVSSWNSRT